VKVAITAFVVPTPDDDLFMRQQIAFYASTPSYRSVMALHGWEAEAEQLSKMASSGQWGDMPGVINDEILNTFAVVAGPGDLAAALLERYRGLADRLSVYMPFVPGQRDELWKALGAVRAG
jgi:hypothetical protein